MQDRKSNTEKPKKQSSPSNLPPTAKAEVYMPRTINILYPPNKSKDGKGYSPFLRSLKSLQTLKQWCVKKNPFAIWFMYLIESEIQVIHANVEGIIQESAKIREDEKQRSGIELLWTEPTKKPRALSIKVTSPQSYYLMLLITRFDMAERACATLERCGIVGAHQLNRKMKASGKDLNEFFHRSFGIEKLIIKNNLQDATFEKLKNEESVKKAKANLEKEINQKMPEGVITGDLKPIFHKTSITGK